VPQESERRNGSAYAYGDIPRSWLVSAVMVLLRGLGLDQLISMCSDHVSTLKQASRR
jgi:hypothetical protein